ncbi:MAG: hypothetical protein HYZ71_01110 [Deltaproteobacteria bacterium]|nr:hypothetical protein [Deltaproteobacteria bacterium]
MRALDHISPIPFIIVSLAISLATGATPPSNSTAFTELFNLKQNASLGELSFRRGTTTEKLSFGATTGLYAIGFEVDSTLLPAPYQNQFKGQQVLQIILGNANPGDKLSQFGSFLLVADVSGNQSQLRVPTKDNQSSRNALYVQFRSPQTPSNTADEEALKSTFFASSGVGRVDPKGKPEGLAVSFSDRRLRFSKRRVRVELNTLLATPFNPESADIKGAIELALFSPGSDETTSFLREVLAETLRAPTPKGPPILNPAKKK